MSWPPTLQDFYALAMSPAACVPDARQVKSINVAAQLFELPGHGLFGGEVLYFQASGANAAPPTGLATTTAYLAVRRNSHFFGITSLDGSPVTFADVGVGVVNVLEDMEPVVLRMLARRTSDVQSKAKAYSPPYSGDVPLRLTGIAVDLAAFDVSKRMRVASPKFDEKKIEKAYDQAIVDLADLDRGDPLAESLTDATPTVADMGAVSVRLESRHFLEGDRA